MSVSLLLLGSTEATAQWSRIHYSVDGRLGAGDVKYDGSSPIRAMISAPCGGGVLTAFTQTPGGNRIHWSPDGNNLGGGQVVYEGSSPVTAMIAYNGGVLTAFTQTPGGNRIHWSPDFAT
jgi:hypothetical protein